MATQGVGPVAGRRVANSLRVGNSAEIVQLVELFQRNVDQYRSPAFFEAAVRHQFIDPLFAALGWDVNNTQGFAEQYKGVVHEDKVHASDATKAPDDSSRSGRKRKFFVEARSPRLTSCLKRLV